MIETLLRIFRRKHEADDLRVAEAVSNLNMRMQRMLALHAQENIQPRPLPRASKAA
jgi:hypothetical protein